MSNAAYQDGFQVAQTDELTGCPLDRKPDENTLIDMLRTMSILLTRDKHDEYEVAWCAGLLAGWFARHSQVAG